MVKGLSNKVILTDVDGVLLDWEYSFNAWMNKHGYEVVPGKENEYNVGKKYGLNKVDKERIVRIFNESATIRKIPPLRDAIKYVKKLHEEHGYVFRVISSLSDDQYSQHLRTKNLREMFGSTVFESYVYLDTGADKDEALAQYKDTGCYWVEDKPENADLGLKLGLESILFQHGHNKSYDGLAPTVKNWKQVYETIVGV